MITPTGAALLSILRKVIVRLHWMSQMGPQINEPQQMRRSAFLLAQSIWARVTEVGYGARAAGRADRAE